MRNTMKRIRLQAVITSQLSIKCSYLKIYAGAQRDSN